MAVSPHSLLMSFPNLHNFNFPCLSFSGSCDVVMASGHVLRSVVLFLIFYIFIMPYLTHNTDEIGLSISDDHSCSFYIANDQITSTFKELQPAMPRRSASIHWLPLYFDFKAAPNYHHLCKTRPTS